MNIDVGSLEEKTILLMESIKRFVENEPFFIVIKPNLRSLSDTTLKYFLSRDVHFHEVDIGNFFTNNIMMSKIFIASYAETLYGEAVEYMLLLDNDTLFLNNIESDLFDMDFLIAIRPTDFSERSLVSFFDCSSTWRYLIQKFYLKENPKWIYRCIRDNTISYASVNSGFVLERSDAKLFYKWKELADSLNNDKEFTRLINEDSDSLHYLDQVLLSLVLMKRFEPEDVKVLNIRYNFSLESIVFNHMLLFLDKRWIFKKIPFPIDSFIHIHYHQRFNQRRILRYFNEDKHVNLLQLFVPFDIKTNVNKKFFSNLLSELYIVIKFTEYKLFHKFRSSHESE
jgi:hypothetical protein